jgi:hypothetical protein
VYYLVLARRVWFFRDEWVLLSARGLNLHDLITAYNGHLVALPIVVYRVLWWAVGLRSYLPYAALAICLHVLIATLLRAIMRRARVGPWIATGVAATFVLFGSGAQNILSGFQITFSGSLALGLTALLLTDHVGPLDRRDYLGVFAAALALLCSGVGVAMVIALAVATRLRRGWRVAALLTVPLGLLYGVWWAVYGRVGAHLQHSSRTLADWIRHGIASTFGDLAQIPSGGWLLAIVVVAGLSLLAARASVDGNARERWTAPAALACGAAAFLVISGISRASFGAGFAASSRYLYVVAALVLPLIGVAIDAMSRRSRTWGVISLAILLVGVPGNIGRARSYANQPLVRNAAFKQTILTIGRDPLAARVPRALRPDPSFAPTVTIAWLRSGVASGRIPSSRADPLTRRTDDLRLSLMELDHSNRHACRPWHAPIVLTLRVGQEIGATGSFTAVLLSRDPPRASNPVAYGSSLSNTAPAHTLIAVAGPETLELIPHAGARLCSPANTKASGARRAGR